MGNLHPKKQNILLLAVLILLTTMVGWLHLYRRSGA